MTHARARAESSSPLLIGICVCASLFFGCASGRDGLNVATRLDEGARAAHAGDFQLAEDALASVHAACGQTLLGRHALLMLAATSLDPRNPGRDPDIAAFLLSDYAGHPETFPWTQPLAETLYLLALEQGGRPTRYGSAASLPMLDDSPPSSEDNASCTKNDRNPVRAAIDLPSLRVRKATNREHALQAEVNELRAELERVRKAVQP